jgi:hypothetical protein
MKFKERYEQLQQEDVSSAKTSATRPMKRRTTQGLLRDTDSDDSDDALHAPIPSSDPWVVEFDQYIKTNDILPEGMSIVTWWGVRTFS